MEQAGQFAVGGIERFQSVGAHPEHGLILMAIAIGVLDGKLRLADPAQPADRLHLPDGCLATAPELFTEPGEFLLASGEERVTWKRKVPDLGQAASRVRWFARWKAGQ